MTKPTLDETVSYRGLREWLLTREQRSVQHQLIDALLQHRCGQGHGRSPAAGMQLLQPAGGEGCRRFPIQRTAAARLLSVAASAREQCPVSKS